jgi:O-antigen/teichoic acid export membrane protein
LSIKKRFIFSVFANFFRAGISLLTGLIVARGLGPSEYGNLAYLLGSFWAFRALLDMGASNAFYTFISRINNSIAYYLIYFSWLLFQFAFLVILIFVLMPTYIQEKLWVNQTSYLIFLALVASYVQNQVWQTIVQIYESQRKTIQVQAVSLFIISVHLFLMIIFWANNLISVPNVLLAIIFEYIAATLWLAFFMRGQHHIEKENKLDLNIRPCLAEYIGYCKPMLVIGVATFLYEFADKWMLQNYSGAAQQGFFQVASQLSTVGLIAATSIMNILWKEVAVSHGKGEKDRIILLHKKTASFLMLLVTSIACFFVPWSKDLIEVMLGLEYSDAWPVLLVMLFYPIHQVMGQLNSTVLMGTSNTSLHMKLTIFGLAISLPVTFFLVVPSSDSWGFGLGMGALGFAIKTVLLNILLVNLQTWFIYRKNNTNYEWLSQFRGLGFCLLLSTLIYWFTSKLNLLIVDKFDLYINLTIFIGIALSAVVYFGIFIASILFTPKLIGIHDSERHELLTMLREARSLIKAKDGK